MSGRIAAMCETPGCKNHTFRLFLGLCKDCRGEEE
jgi:hypothetical protein